MPDLAETVAEIPIAQAAGDLDALIAAIRTEVPPLTPNVLAGLEQLDAPYTAKPRANHYRAFATADVVGVVAGVKPAAFVYKPDIGVAYEGIVNALGLQSIDDPRVPEEAILSRHARIARALGAASVDPSSDETQRLIGKLLGYPPTATDYFIKRRPTVNTPRQLPVVYLPGAQDNFAHLILSPDNYEREAETYVLPLQDAVHILAPNTYKQIIGARTRAQNDRWHRLGRIARK